VKLGEKGAEGSAEEGIGNGREIEGIMCVDMAIVKGEREG